MDNYTADALQALAPHKSVFDLNTPKKVSSNLSMPKPVVATISHWYHAIEDYVDPLKLQRMEALFIN